MRIALDVMGGDHGPEVIIAGAIQALKAYANVGEIRLVGKEDEIEPIVSRLWPSRERMTIVHASEVLGMAEKPVAALRRKKDCSMLRTVEQVKEGTADAALSPGNTGAMVAASMIRLRPQPLVDRPGLATVIPTQRGKFVLIDSGATVDPRPTHLVQYALMGHVFAQKALGVTRPRVGLLSVGSEPTKGNELTLETFDKLSKAEGIHFIGNVEGYDLFRDAVDVVVCDGFVGNITLKTCEGLATSIMGWIREEMTANPWRKAAAAALRPAFRPIKRQMDPDTHGGGLLLGLNGAVMIAHGSASANAIENAIRILGDIVDDHVGDHIRELIAKTEARLRESDAVASG